MYMVRVSVVRESVVRASVVRVRMVRVRGGKEKKRQVNKHRARGQYLFFSDVGCTRDITWPLSSV